MKLTIRNPATGAVIATVPADSAATVRRKFERAREAQPAWAATPIADRIAVTRRFATLLETRRDELARTLTREVGKPITQSLSEIDGVLARIGFFVQHVESVARAETVFEDERQRLSELITHEPLGVVANISAWNYPYFVGGNVFVPALLTGNAVLYKPSEYATLTGLAIARLWHDAGVPEAIFCPVTGAADAGGWLLRQPLDGVFFTGSHATGRHIAASAARRLIKCQLELGGKDPIYVCDDVDLQAAAAGIADGAFYNTGQSCCAVERIYVHERIYEPFIAAFLTAVKSFKVGDPRLPATYIGPLARKAQIAVLRQQVADATRRGARLVLGGRALARKGNYFAPTVLVDTDHRMKVMREESFGPVIGIQRVRGDDEALRLMNDTRYGLTAGVYTPDRARAEAILARVKSGSAYWNCCDRVSPRLPWSGIGHSGLGVTLSTYGIQTFLRPRAWHLRAA